ncbi:ssDNA-binding domain-containing protein, partial [Neorhizobium sp. T786]|uniref:ArdC family protein n=1 Tax=Pseudorhizobium xiangyangii TaxID=2883104 RepID=UPI001CFF55E1
FARPLRANGEPYRGINILLLWMASATNGFEHDRFMTYRQAQELGGQVRKGEQGTLIVKYGTITRAEPSSDGASDDEERQIPFLKSYSVFNVSQIEGLPEEFHVRPEAQPQEDRMAAVDAFIAKTQARIVHGGSRACYVPALDLIRMPPFAAFSSSQSFYSTTLHELTHWTGASHRLDRLETADKRKASYHFEELVAEMTACFLCCDLQITAEVREESASYLASWLAVMRQDRRMIFRAASKAQAAADYLHTLQDDTAA